MTTNRHARLSITCGLAVLIAVTTPAAGRGGGGGWRARRRRLRRWRIQRRWRPDRRRIQWWRVQRCRCPARVFRQRERTLFAAVGAVLFTAAGGCPETCQHSVGRCPADDPVVCAAQCASCNASTRRQASELWFYQPRGHWGRQLWHGDNSRRQHDRRDQGTRWRRSGGRRRRRWRYGGCDPRAWR